MLHAQDLMNDNPSYCQLDDDVRSITQRFAKENISGMLVVDEEQRLHGIITETDLVEQQGKLHLPTAIALFDMVIPLGEQRFENELNRLMALKAADLMQTDVVTVDADASLVTIFENMSEKHVHHLAVLESDAVIGMISGHDVIRAMANHVSEG
ncbi:MAG: CBS domain-containing protein [Mariprofundaceae bacterium]|nr:CBS domain-containing protein [Mariprofundaceae bacterium]